MKETMNMKHRSAGRSQLLVTASVMALTALIATQSSAYASSALLSSSDDPPFWIEFGGNFDQIKGTSDLWMPPPAPANPDFGTGVQDRKEPLGSFGMEGQLSYRADDWVVSLSTRYGRTHSHKIFHTQTSLTQGGVAFFYGSVSRHTESHLVMDFQVGKDVGLGSWGRGSHSIVSGGVRIAQFSANVADLISSVPVYNDIFHQHLEVHNANIDRSTSAIGPEISWNASAPVLAMAGSSVILDWGVEGALLFGRQRVTGQFVSRYSYNGGYGFFQHTSSSSPRRTKTIIIPNVNAFAGISYHFPAAKIAIGYRADMYFNGMDGGVAAAHRINRSFYGPFINIGFGIGD